MPIQPSSQRNDKTQFQTAEAVAATARSARAQPLQAMLAHPCDMPFNCEMTGVVSEYANSGGHAGPGLGGGFGSGIAMPRIAQPNGLSSPNDVFGSSLEAWRNSPDSDASVLYGVRVGPRRDASVAGSALTGTAGIAEYQGARVVFQSPALVPFIPLSRMSTMMASSGALSDFARFELRLVVHYYELTSAPASLAWRKVRGRTVSAMDAKSGEWLDRDYSDGADNFGGYTASLASDTMAAAYAEYAWLPANPVSVDAPVTVRSFDAADYATFFEDRGETFGGEPDVGTPDRVHVVSYALAVAEVPKRRSGGAYSMSADEYASANPRIVWQCSDAVVTAGMAPAASVGDNVLMRITAFISPAGTYSAPYKYLADIYKEEYSSKGSAGDVVFKDQELWLSKVEGLWSTSEEDRWYFGQRRGNHWEGIKKKR